LFIALEGADGVGKSTLAKRIEEMATALGDVEVALVHHSQLKRDPIDEYELDYESYHPGSGRTIIADRLHWGEDVYGPLYRGASALTTAKRRHIELFLRSRGACVFLVEQSYDVLVDRLEMRGEDYLKPEHVQHVLDAFHAVSATSLMSCGTFSPTYGTTDPISNQICTTAKMAESQCLDLVSFDSYIGSPFPAVLLLGERRGGQPPYSTRLAFLPVKSNSGAFLLGSLPDPFWRDVGIANALDEDVRALVSVLGDPPVVALGRTASLHLDSLGIDHAAVPHPQYVRRFFNSRQEEYGELIAEAAKTGNVRLSWPR